MVSLPETVCDFPVWGLLPRKETEALNFIQKYPIYNGKDVIIAIFDSGVDPSAPGLQYTPDKEVKVIDRIDASGAGDIDTSTVVEAEVGKTIEGLTGRTLKIPENWKNPSKEYHIGVIQLYRLYPQRLKERIIKERKEKSWDPIHRAYLSKAQKNIQSLKRVRVENQVPLNSRKHMAYNNNRPTSPKLSDDEELQKENAEAELALLKQLEKKYNDVGPSYDCVVFHDGSQWRVCIDTTEEGRLNNGLLLGEYRKTFDYKLLNPVDQYTISVNVHDGGNILEIVGMCCDNRLGSMETGTALSRAMNRVMSNPDYKVDIINMSYGEHAHWSNSGRLGELTHEVVNKYGVIWVSSAGNHGPALSTVGVPPDFFSDSIIGVGAYVSPDMMAAEYSMADKLPGRPYTWSSRGPTADGGRGVSVCAPGGAITSVPKFTLKSNQLMNGTSMASPHTAGCVALILSAMKQMKKPYSPYLIRRAFEHTAMPLETDIFAQGHGLVKVEKAMDYLLSFPHEPESKFRFKLECGKEHGKGIHIRNWVADKPIDVSVSVEPVIFDETRADPESKIKFSLELVLVCDALWVRHPQCLQTSYTSRSFKVSLDPKGLERGRVYFSTIRAYIATKPEKGAMFEVPITMVVPHIDLAWNYQFVCKPTVYKSGHIERHFVYVPLEATYASVTVKASGAEKVQRFTLHTVQLKPMCSVTTLEYYKVLNLGPNESASPVIGVEGGLTLEICLARWWSCVVEGQVEIVVDFHGLFTPQEMVSFANSDGVHRIDVKASLRTEELMPQAVVKYHSQVTPKCCLLSHVLYESSYESQLWMLFDSGKQLLCSGDAFSSKYNCKLDKGSYIIKRHVRHEKSEYLEKLNELPLTILTKLSQEVKLDIYSCYSSAVTNGRKVQSLVLSEGSVQPLYLTPPNLSEKSLRSLSLSAGDVLVGTISFGKDENVRKAVSKHKFGIVQKSPDSIPLRIYLTDIPSKKKSTSTDSKEEKKESKVYSDYEEALKDFRANWIAKLDVDSSEKLFKELPNHEHLQSLLSYIQALDNVCTDSQESRKELIRITDIVKSNVQIETLLAYQGTKTDVRQDAAKIKAQMERQKNVFIEAIARRGNAIYASMKDNDSEAVKKENLANLDSIATDLLKLTESSDTKVINFFINYYKARDCRALACRLLTKLNDEKPSKENDNRLLDLYNQLDWCHVNKFFKSVQNAKFPHSYARF
ncbi:Tripeptidyl-peptidase 2 [Armadillidium nasatum]|uniref:Tripeptidyl-peptidase 2 n=1 Tax=Armadillidium nasatum TaxID=96803 RepID=A0A5N5SUF5_9CRUS|nr:Tripeptidyl-peptidase 2 [Armadillidium nasatum]